LADGIAVEGVRLVFENLPKVYADPNDIEARGHLMSAAAMGATAFQKGLGAIHALSHPVGALYDTHHGMTNAVFMPYVLVVNRSAIEGKIKRLAAYCGLEPSFDAFLAAVLDLRKALRVPHTLKDFNVDGAQRQLIGDMAIVDPTAGGNPKEMTLERALDIFDRAMDGDFATAH
jgi:alcohol dehydrogenase